MITTFIVPHASIVLHAMHTMRFYLKLSKLLVLSELNKFSSGEMQVSFCNEFTAYLVKELNFLP